jgi:Holliday junction resolvase
MSDFEREIVHCLNHFFKTRNIQGFAYRLKQSRYTNQPADVLVDSLNPDYHLLIECKSIIDKKLYFSQHFPSDKDGIHQVDAISEFLNETGRIGYLAVEFRQSPGMANEAFLIPWPVVVGYYKADKGITIDDARAGIALSRSKGGYLLETLNAK